ncbi:CRISPR-associated CARF protein Csx1 [Thermosulfurimonas dismutans]|uniref:CRISPR-associated protein DxTHG n=1 Tax=Thermosulfurimonas dismutans TaxID=999894 RepID=A0A179D580_9BACT|nr:CRISPR-associated CARF protein Csx1 [Thermosulfurimonas dismutans]OAQ20758.1 CRISPR-associated protein DxTHG [Thermosulfurimonas dismutans]
MKLLIAPWGNPFGWNEVTYRFGEVESVSKTSLKVLLEALNPEYIVILVADSLVDKDSLRENTNYAEAKAAVRDKIFNFLKDCHIPLDKTKIDILVLPGTGYFKNGVFEGEVLDYYYRLLYELARLLNESDFKEVHLDLTHGLNFMPVLTYRAVKEILQVVSFFAPIKFVAYNADPFVSGGPETVLTLHVVEEIEELPRFPALSPYEVNVSSRFFEKLVVDENGQKLKVVGKPRLKEILTFLGGMVYGLPLMLTTFFVPAEEVFSHLKEALNIYEKEIKIRKEGGRLRLTRRARLTPLFRVLTLVWLLLKFFEKENLLETRQEEIFLHKLESIAKKVFWKNNIFRSILGTEMHNLKSIKGFPFDWKLLAEIEGRKPDSPNPRNFFAHGGLEKNAVELRQTEEGLKIRYSKEKKNNVQNFILKSLR